MKDVPTDQRPREKLLSQGAAALADAELLALLLRTGYKGCGVVTLAQRVLGAIGGYAGLLNATPGDLRAIKGLGPAKRAELMAVVEMARRALSQRLADAPLMDNPQLVRDYLALHLGRHSREVFCVMFLDVQLRLQCVDDMFHGTLTQASVHPREVVRRALALNACAVVLAHNHPSGVAEPSRADVYLTHTLRTALGLVDVRVLDHLVVGGGEVVSMSERGLI
jgi:DNA repair protein RadC